MQPSIPITPGLRAIYDAIYNQITACERFVGNASSLPLDRLFPRAMNTWSAHRVLNVAEADPLSGKVAREDELIDYVIGKTGSYGDGMRIGAAGNTQANVTINDQSHTKMHVAILPIHPGDDDMDELAHNQSVGLYDIEVKLSGGPTRHGELQGSSNALVRSFIGDGPTSYMHDGVRIGPFKVVTDDIYTVESKKNAKTPAAAPVRTSRKRKAGDNDGPVQNADAGSSAAGSHSSHASASDVPLAITEAAAPQVALDALYHFSVLPDHVGPRYEHVNARVVQFNIRDINNDLVPPWELKRALRPGTLVLVACNNRVWEMPDTGKGRMSLTFQMGLKSLKVLKESDLPADTIDPSAVDSGPAPAQTTSTVPAAIADELASFTLPTTSSTVDIAMPVDDEMIAAPVGDETVAIPSAAKGKKKRGT